MGNRQKGEVGFEADGKPYTLVFSINALCELEDRMGEAVSGIDSLASSRKRFRTIRTVFLCGLLDHHPELTEREAGRIIDAIGIERADALVGEAFALAFPEAKPLPLDSKPAPASRARTGLPS